MQPEKQRDLLSFLSALMTGEKLFGFHEAVQGLYEKDYDDVMTCLKAGMNPHETNFTLDQLEPFKGYYSYPLALTEMINLYRGDLVENWTKDVRVVKGDAGDVKLPSNNRWGLSLGAALHTDGHPDFANDIYNRVAEAFGVNLEEMLKPIPVAPMGRWWFADCNHGLANLTAKQFAEELDSFRGNPQKFGEAQGSMTFVKKEIEGFLAGIDSYDEEVERKQVDANCDAWAEKAKEIDALRDQIASLKAHKKELRSFLKDCKRNDIETKLLLGTVDGSRIYPLQTNVDLDPTIYMQVYLSSLDIEHSRLQAELEGPTS